MMHSKLKFFALGRLPPTLMSKDMIMRGLAVTGRKSKNVEGKKNKHDLMKGKIFARLGTRIILAAKAGGLDPAQNIELARALKVAKEEKLPKENIERALQKASDVNSGSIQHRLYEVFGHGGVGLVVSAVTDNTNRVFMAVKAAVRKNDAKMAAEGSVLFKFAEKCCIAPSVPYNPDSVLEAAIEADVQDVTFHTPTVHHDGHDELSSTAPQQILVEVADTTNMEDALAKIGINGVRHFAYLPSSLVAVDNEAHREQNLSLIEDLEDVDDIDAVFHDMEL